MELERNRSFMELQRRIENAMEADRELRELREQMRFLLIQEGLVIQVLDTDKRPMFQRGSDKVEPHMSRLLQTMAPLLNELPNRLMISGHTDSFPYPGDNLGYSNWELSTDRANASRRELMVAGMDDVKLLRVVGMADSAHIQDADPFDPVNRRIELLLLDDHAASRIMMPIRGNGTGIPQGMAPFIDTIERE